MPLKREAVALVDDLTERARLAGRGQHRPARGRPPGRRTTPTSPARSPPSASARGADLTSAAILGGGATATSVGLALADLGVRVAGAASVARAGPRRRDPSRPSTGIPGARTSVVGVLDDPAPLEADLRRLHDPRRGPGPPAGRPVPRTRRWSSRCSTTRGPRRWPRRSGDRVLVSGLDLLRAPGGRPVRALHRPAGAARRHARGGRAGAGRARGGRRTPGVSDTLLAVLVAACCAACSACSCPGWSRAVPEPAPTSRRRRRAAAVEAPRGRRPARTPSRPTPTSPRRPGLGWQSAVVCAGCRGRSSARRPGWDWPLLFLVPLVPVGVALAVHRLAHPAAAHAARRCRPTLVAGRRWSSSSGLATDEPRRAGAGAGRRWWPSGWSSGCCGSSGPPAWASATCGSRRCSGIVLGYLGWGELAVGVWAGFLAFGGPGAAAGRRTPRPLGCSSRPSRSGRSCCRRPGRASCAGPALSRVSSGADLAAPRTGVGAGGPA